MTLLPTRPRRQWSYQPPCQRDSRHGSGLRIPRLRLKAPSGPQNTTTQRQVSRPRHDLCCTRLRDFPLTGGERLCNGPRLGLGKLWGNVGLPTESRHRPHTRAALRPKGGGGRVGLFSEKGWPAQVSLSSGGDREEMTAVSTSKPASWDGTNEKRGTHLVRVTRSRQYRTWHLDSSEYRQSLSFNSSLLIGANDVLSYSNCLACLPRPALILWMVAASPYF